MTLFISHVHADLRRSRLTRRGATHRVEDVPRGTHKQYPRMEQIALPAPRPITNTLAETLQNRHSCFSCDYETPFTLEELGSLLGHAFQKRPDSQSRNYPSGGALYPIETYIFTSQLKGHEPAAFHYNPTGHTLEKLWALPPGFDMKSLAQYPEGLMFSTLIVFTAVWKRSSAKYGDFTYTLALLEAGHMSENIVLTATALGLASRPMTGFNDDVIPTLLDLNEEDEQPVHSVVLGKKSAYTAKKEGNFYTED